jgi:dTDP-4-amino-4,6-dideoxygalactose transaminase
MYGMVDKDHIVIHGINSRLDELQAAILRVKLKYLDTMNERRRRIANYYRDVLRHDMFRHQEIPNNVQANYHVFVSRFMGDREHLISFLARRGIQTNVYYPLPQCLQRANRYLGYRRGDFPNAEKICDEVIALPMYPEFDRKSQCRVIEAINNFCARCDHDRS